MGSLTSAMLDGYLTRERLPHTGLSEGRWRFKVPCGLEEVLGRDSHLIETVDQGDGLWSVSTILFELPTVDSPELCRLFRTLLVTRGSLTSSVSIFMDDDFVEVGIDAPLDTGRELVNRVQDVAEVATPLLARALRVASANGLELKM